MLCRLKAERPDATIGLFAQQPQPWMNDEVFERYVLGTASNTAEQGAPAQTSTIGDNGAGTKVTISGSQTEASMEMDATHTADGVTTKLKIHMKVLPCPDADGRFTAEATADMSAAAGSTGQTGTLEVTLHGEVDDNAEPVSLDYDYRMQWANFAGGKGKFADVSGGLGKTPVLNRTGGAVTSEFATQTYATGQTFGLLVASTLSNSAKRGYQSGRCLKLDTTASPGPTGMEPGATSAVTASTAMASRSGRRFLT